MPLENAVSIAELVASNPSGSDSASGGDNHIRMLKTVLQGSFPNLAGAAFATAEVNGNYSVTLADHMTIKAFTVAATVTLPNSVGIDKAFCLMLAARGGTVTITPTDSVINGATSLSLPTGTVAFIFARTGAYYAFVAPAVITALGLSLLLANDVATLKALFGFQHGAKLGDNDIEPASLNAALAVTGVAAGTYETLRNVTVNAQGRLTAIAGGRTASYVSAYGAIENKSFATGLTTVPALVCLDFKCLEAEGSWVVGDVLTFNGSNINYTNNTSDNPMTAATRHGWVLKLGTTINFVLGSNGLYFFTPAGGYMAVTLSKWEMRLRAYVL